MLFCLAFAPKKGKKSPPSKNHLSERNRIFNEALKKEEEGEGKRKEKGREKRKEEKRKKKGRGKEGEKGEEGK